MEKKIINITPVLNPKQKIAMKTLISTSNGVNEILYGGG